MLLHKSDFSPAEDTDVIVFQAVIVCGHLSQGTQDWDDINDEISL
jgi:hypothetical protein